MTQQQWGQPRQGPGGPWGQPAPWNQGGPWGQSAGPWGQSAGPWNQPGYGRAPQGGGFGGLQPRQPLGAPSPFGPAPRRRRSPLGKLLLAGIVVALISMFGTVGANSVNEPAAQQYENEDYRVPPPDKSPPPLPVPETYEEAEQLVVSNPFYRQTAPRPVQCTAQPINVATADNDQLKSHFETLMECAVRVWQPPVEAAGFEIVRPTVTIYGDEVTTKCGKSEVNAFYCSADQQVYFSNRLPDYVTIVKRNKWAADVVMAHEFAHALQARTAILVSSHALGQNSGSKSTELEMSRRLETQADCFAGMFTLAVSQALGIKQSDVRGIEETFAAVGDDTISGNPNVVGNHGLASSRQRWGVTGLGTSDVGQCNTFRASKSSVR